MRKNAIAILLATMCCAAHAQVPIGYRWLCSQDGRSVGIMIIVPVPGQHLLQFAEEEHGACADRDAAKKRAPAVQPPAEPKPKEPKRST